jgi:DNA-binding transcriptional MerR regulator
MYTIKQAAARSGVSVDLLRAWERRYGVVSPVRTAAGYRLYDEAAIARLRAMRGLVDAGWSPSAAAARLSDTTDADIESLSGAPAPSPSPAGSDEELVGRLVRAAAVLDAAVVEQLLDEAFGRGSFEHVTERLVLPALRAIGDEWAAGRLDIAAEHAASHAVLRRLAGAYDAAGRPAAPRGAILVGLPPGARHELGALAFAAAARRAGLPVLYLGADLPATDWVEAARETSARAAVIGAPTGEDREPARRVARELQAGVPDLVVAFGGRSAPNGRTLRLPEGLIEAVDALRSSLR